jgi:hypothetical protein
MFAPYGDALAATARDEALRRRDSFPALVRARQVDAETATLNYQAWCAIAQFMRDGRSKIIGSYGGVADRPTKLIDWPLLEEVAAKEVEAVRAKLDEGDGVPLDDPLRGHFDKLVLIQKAVSRTRWWLEETNRLLRHQANERRQAQAA